MTLPFENDTGPVIKKLASRSIQTDKRRNLFVIVTIALAAALMAAIFCAGAGSDRKLEADIRGQYQAVVVNCDRDTIERLKDCPEVERWGLSQNYGSARYGDSVLTVEKMRGEWNYSHTTEIDHFTVVKCSKCGHEAFAMAIHVKDGNFCPHCGAPMTDEAVEMVTERLGALNDAVD